jgi:spore maturation protein SpmB
MRADPITHLRSWSERDGRAILARALPRTGRTVLLLCRLMLPISFAVAALRWTGLLDAIGHFCAPAMALVRLPGEAAVPLVTGFLAGIYALLGAAAMLPLSPEAITILGGIALVAHNLIIESSVQDRAGTPWWWMVGVRLFAGLAAGLCVAWSIAALQALHVPALWLRCVPVSSHTAVPAAGSFMAFLGGWGREALALLAKIILVVTAMMIATEWIRAIGVMAKLERLAQPALRWLGLSQRVAFPWLTAQLVGVTFGSGLLIEEVRERNVPPREVRALHTSIGINHSLFEDTLLLATIGASLFWIIVPRVLLAALMVRLTARLPQGLRANPSGQ